MKEMYNYKTLYCTNIKLTAWSNTLELRRLKKAGF